MAGINKVILIGNLGNDPDMRYMPNGEAVANFSVATSETWNDRNTGERREKTEWHRVVAFRKLAEIIGQYCRKGSKIYIEGKLQTRKWTDQSGQDRYITEIIADQMQMLDSRSGQDNGNSGNYQNNHNGNYQNNNSGYQNQNRGNSGQNTQQQTPTNPTPPQQSPAIDQDEGFDQDIPF